MLYIKQPINYTDDDEETDEEEGTDGLGQGGSLINTWNSSTSIYDTMVKAELLYCNQGMSYYAVIYHN